MFHATIFAGVKGEDRDAPAGFERVGQLAQQEIEDAELVVHGDAERLEDAAHGVVARVVAEVTLMLGEDFANGVGERLRAREGRGGAARDEFAREEFRVRLVGVFREGGGEFFRGDAGEPVGRGGRTRGVEAKIERAVGFEGEATRRVVDLHRGNAEVGEDRVDAFAEAVLGEHFGQAGEIGAHGREHVFAPAGGAEAGGGFGQLDRIDVERDHASARGDAGEEFARVTTETERAIHGDMAGREGEDLEDFRDHDRAVGAGGGFAGSEDLSDVAGVTLGVVLLVFFLEAARIFSRVTRAAFVRRGGGGRRGRGGRKGRRVGGLGGGRHGEEMHEVGGVNKTGVKRVVEVVARALCVCQGADLAQKGGMRLAKFWIGVVAAVMAGAQLAAQQITILNAGFEDPEIDDNSFFTGAPPSDWMTFGLIDQYQARDVGVLNPTGSGLYPGAPERSNVAVVFLWNTSHAPTSHAAGLQQTLGDALQLNTTYTFSVEVGNIANTAASLAAGFDFAGFPGYRIELLAGGNVIAFEENTVAPGEGQFLTATLNYNVGSSNPNAGGALGIRLINLDAAAGIEVNFDDVQLSAVAIPEATTVSLWLGCAALVGAGVRRRDRVSRG